MNNPTLQPPINDSTCKSKSSPKQSPRSNKSIKNKKEKNMDDEDDCGYCLLTYLCFCL